MDLQFQTLLYIMQTSLLFTTLTTYLIIIILVNCKVDSVAMAVDHSIINSIHFRFQGKTMKWQMSNAFNYMIRPTAVRAVIKYIPTPSKWAHA